jgi:molybdopterin converting factor subunit 1
MNIQILAFGIARDILKKSTLNLSLDKDVTVGDLKAKLCDQYPEFELLRSFSIAVNEEYRKDDFVLSENDEIVIIPPVSGG